MVLASSKLVGLQQATDSFAVGTDRLNGSQQVVRGKERSHGIGVGWFRPAADDVSFRVGPVELVDETRTIHRRWYHGVDCRFESGKC